MTAIPLRQNTAVDVLIGPFEDPGDGYTAEVGLSPSVKLSKNGQALAAKNDATTPVHDADGYYNCELDATDTNTVGALVLTVAGSATALGIRHNFVVMDQQAYDALYASPASLLDSKDIGLLYKSTIGTVTSQVQYIMDDAITTGDIVEGCCVTIEDAGDSTNVHLTFVSDVDETTETIVVDSAPPWTVAAGDIVRVMASAHPAFFVAAIKAKTDQISFGAANAVDANITNVAGGTDLTAAGTGGQEYGET